MRELTKTEESTASTLKGANCQCECVECECVELEYSPIPHPACPLHGELGEEILVQNITKGAVVVVLVVSSVGNLPGIIS